MNDYGLFQAINSRLKCDDFLGTKLQGLFSQNPASVAFPHAKLQICDVVTDGFRPPCKLTVDFKLTLFSQYTGFKEIHQLMSRIVEVLESAPLALKASDLFFASFASLRLCEQNIKQQKDERTREGTLEYQALIKGRNHG